MISFLHFFLIFFYRHLFMIMFLSYISMTPYELRKLLNDKFVALPSRRQASGKAVYCSSCYNILSYYIRSYRRDLWKNNSSSFYIIFEGRWLKARPAAMAGWGHKENKHTRAHTHARTHARTHTHTHTYIYIYIYTKTMNFKAWAMTVTQALIGRHFIEGRSILYPVTADEL